MSPRAHKFMTRLAALRRELDEIERLVKEEEGVARVSRGRAKKAKAARVKKVRKARAKKVTRKVARKKAARRANAAATARSQKKAGKAPRRPARRANGRQLDLEHDFLAKGRGNGTLDRRAAGR